MSIEYTPDVNYLEQMYIEASMSKMDVPVGERDAVMDALRAEFRRGIDSIRADAWNVGVKVGYDFGRMDGKMSHAYAVPTCNPYDGEVEND